MKTQMLAISTLATISSLFSAVSASAQDGIKLGIPAYGGTGCPAGTASVSLSPDSTSLSVLFDQYTVEAGRTVGKRVDRKSCNVAIPVHVPQGLSVSVFQVDYRGYNSLPQAASSDFSVEYFFAGSMGPRYTRTFRGQVDDDFLISNTLEAAALIWSACGQDVNLRTNSSMRVTTNARGEQTTASVDSADIKSGLIYHFQWKRCNGSSFDNNVFAAQGDMLL